MLKLSEVLAEWTPAEGAGSREPIELLEAGWHEIVGPNVAQHSRPTRIAQGTLTITTRSSAWSHQLSFLSDHVLAAVTARLPAATIRRLRFKVGRLVPMRDVPPQRRRKVRRASAAPSERAEAASLEGALARFREDVEQQRHARRSRGWRECGLCGALVLPAGGLCAACESARSQAISAATARLLYEAPWLGFAGTAALVDGLQEREYERIRSRMLAHWWGLLARLRVTKRISRDGRERLVASSYVLLQSKLAPEAILPATVRSILGDELHQLLYDDADQADACNTKTKE